MSVGHLVASWSNCETLLRGLFIALTGGSSDEAADYAELNWISHINSKARRDLLWRFAHYSDLPQNFKDEFHHLLDRFKGISEARNFYCHALYSQDSLDNMTQIEGYILTFDKHVWNDVIKPANRATVNEIKVAIETCNGLNREIAGFILAVRRQLQAQHPVLPPMPDDYPNNPRFPLPKKA